MRGRLRLAGGFFRTLIMKKKREAFGLSPLNVSYFAGGTSISRSPSGKETQGWK